MKNLVRFGIFSRLFRDLKLLYALIKDYWRGEYRDVSYWSIAVFILSVTYILSPFDFLPDYFPLLGQIDDIAILVFALYFLEKDLNKYRDWKNSKNLDA